MITMIKPEMIIFDYGETLVNERGFDGLKGTEAVLHASGNIGSISFKEVQALAEDINREVGRYREDFEKNSLFEIHNHVFQNYLYEYFNIELKMSPYEVERIFWNAASPARPTPNIKELLYFLDIENIRTAVISNMSFSGKVLNERINEVLPGNRFEFILASSEYIFRKPHRRIFELALRKAGLKPSLVWYCGDNPYYDVDGAAESGLYPVWYGGKLDNIGKCTPKADYLKITDWKELIEILEKLA